MRPVTFYSEIPPEYPDPPEDEEKREPMDTEDIAYERARQRDKMPELWD